MKISSEIMVKAHKLTKEIKTQYPEVNYQFQLGICIRFLLNNKEENMNRVNELMETLNISEVEAKELVAVEQHYQAEFNETDKIRFTIWSKYGNKRAYVNAPWRSKNANAKGNYYNFSTKYLQDRYIGKQF